MSDVLTEVLFSPIRAGVLLYDVATLPLYTLAQWPFSQWSKIWRTRSIPEKTDDPAGPWVSTAPLLQNDYANCQSYPEMVDMAVVKFSNRKCFGYRKLLEEIDGETPDGRKMKKKVLDNKYTWMTYAEVGERIEKIIKGLIAIGVKPGDNVVLLMETRLEWQIFAQAIIKMGAVLCTLYSTLGEEGIVQSIKETEATHVVCSPDLIASLKSFHKRVPKVTCLITANSKNNNSSDNHLRVVDMDELLRYGSSTQDSVKVSIKRDDIAMIMYTSGSTGQPKGVMMSHGNLVSAFNIINSQLGQYHWGKKPDQSFYMAFLPLAHIFEFTIEMTQILYGCSIGFASPLTMLDTSPGIAEGTLGDAGLLKPTMMVAVPLVLDKMRAAIQGQVSLKGKLFQKLFSFAVNYKTFWASLGFSCPLINRIVFKKTKSLLGGKVVHVYVGSAPISEETQKFARAALDIELMQGYGATECVAVTSAMDMWDHSLGNVGRQFSEIRIKLKDWKEAGYSPLDKPHPRGEICIAGGMVTMGYYKRKQETDEAYEVDKDGTRWFISGDIGQFETNGNLKIIDRKKDLIKLQNGEYISLGKVEAALKLCPYVENICVYGDSLTNFVVALVLPNRLTVFAMAKTLGRTTSNWKELCADEDVVMMVLSSLRSLGRDSGLGTKELPVKIKLCPEDWTPATELVTASMKIRRRPLCDYYRISLDQLCQL